MSIIYLVMEPEEPKYEYLPQSSRYADWNRIIDLGGIGELRIRMICTRLIDRSIRVVCT